MSDIIWRISSLGQLALLLEASSPKPGNVNRNACFSDTEYRHFLASAALMSRGLNLCASQGSSLVSNRIDPMDIGLGKLVETCVVDSLTGFNQRNTILGSVLLYVPLAVALSASVTRLERFDHANVQHWLRVIIDNTTVDDTLHLYRAFGYTNPGGRRIKEDSEWSEDHQRYDIDNPNAVSNIIEDNVTLIELFRMSSNIDEISNEWASHFNLILYDVYPYIKKISHSLEVIEESIVQTFVWLLSRRPDGLIIKKVGRARAHDIQNIATRIMDNWSEERGQQELIMKLDEILRDEDNLLNPGTTADIVSAATFCQLVSFSFPEASQERH